MSNDVLIYNLFINTNRTVIFGDGTGGTSYYSGTDSVVPVYATIGARQNVGIGMYSNTLNIELKF